MNKEIKTAIRQGIRGLVILTCGVSLRGETSKNVQAMANCCTSCELSGLFTDSCINLPEGYRIAEYGPVWYSLKPHICEVSEECGNLELRGCEDGPAGVGCRIEPEN
jgi:hypothetical protein